MNRNAPTTSGAFVGGRAEAILPSEGVKSVVAIGVMDEASIQPAPAADETGDGATVGEEVTLGFGEIVGEGEDTVRGVDETPQMTVMLPVLAVPKSGSLPQLVFENVREQELFPLHAPAT